MTADILDAIDAATEQRCACGCGRPLPADGLSAWFASQDCQHQWHQRHATEPDDVYDRDDYEGYDAPAPVRTPSPSGRLRYQPPAARPALPRPPHPVSAEVVVAMSDGSRITYTFPEGVNPEINLDMSNDLDDDPYGMYTGMRRYVTVNQRVAMTIAVDQGRNTRTDGTLFTMTMPPDRVAPA